MKGALRAELDTLAAAGLDRQLRVPPAGLDFSSNDYLGLAQESVVVEARRGAGASRLITGHHRCHAELEQRFAAFAGLESALLFTSGYVANVGTITGLLGAEDVVFSDALNHASIIDGCRLSRAAVNVYPHKDLLRLRDALKKCTARRKLVVSDAVFSMDGDAAPLRELRELCDEFDAWLMVDEAHSVGVLGPRGQGLCAMHEVTPDVWVAPLGKAFGAMGAIVAGPAELTELLVHRARSFVFSTGMSPVMVQAIDDSLTRVLGADSERIRALERAQELRQGLRQAGLEVSEGDAAIVPVVVGEPRRAVSLSQILAEAGVIALPIRPPTVARGTSRVRLTTTALHRAEDVRRVIDVLAGARA